MLNNKNISDLLSSTCDLMIARRDGQLTTKEWSKLATVISECTGIPTKDYLTEKDIWRVEERKIDAQGMDSTVGIVFEGTEKECFTWTGKNWEYLSNGSPRFMTQDPAHDDTV